MATVSNPVLSIVALAGRRVDAENTKDPRFPASNIGRVRMEIANRLRDLSAIVLVSSAACGADLLALDAADELGIRCRVVLPFTVERFRLTSVVDRPPAAYWGELFDRVVRAAHTRNDVVVLDPIGGSDDESYAAANQAIIDEAIAIAKQSQGSAAPQLISLIVWDGAPRASADATQDFLAAAERAGFASAKPVMTLGTPDPLQT